LIFVVSGAKPPVFVVQNALKPLMNNDYLVGAVFLRSTVFANKKPPEGGLGASTDLFLYKHWKCPASALMRP
jgi:hypothetical protein